MTWSNPGCPEWLKEFERQLERAGPAAAAKLMKRRMRRLTFEQRMELVEWWTPDKLGS